MANNYWAISIMVSSFLFFSANRKHIALDMRNITLNNWNNRTWWKGRRADSGWRGGEQADAPKGPQAARAHAGGAGRGGVSLPQPIFFTILRVPRPKA